MIRVSAGTARVLGLNRIKTEVDPTTAYFLLGDKCSRSCGFCARSRSSTSGAGTLSRVTWPLFPAEKVIENLSLAYSRGDLGRVCLQVVHDREAWKKARRVLEMVTGRVSIPVSVSCTAGSLKDIQDWFDAGAERFGLALDAASEKVFHAVKGGGFRRSLDLLYNAAGRWAGQISTHLIVGLGETDREITAALQEMINRKIRVGLFAFTPVRGTGLQRHSSPPLYRYRRIQAAHYLMTSGSMGFDDFRYDGQGNLVSLGQPPDKLARLLAGGDAFRTSGCAMCNRPFYNERPGGDIYNYPRQLSPEETAAALLMLSGTDTGGNRPLITCSGR